MGPFPQLRGGDSGAWERFPPPGPSSLDDQARPLSLPPPAWCHRLVGGWGGVEALKGAAANSLDAGCQEGNWREGREERRMPEFSLNHGWSTDIRTSLPVVPTASVTTARTPRRTPSALISWNCTNFPGRPSTAATLAKGSEDPPPHHHLNLVRGKGSPPRASKMIRGSTSST